MISDKVNISSLARKMLSSPVNQHLINKPLFIGLLVGLSVISIWAISLTFFLSIDATKIPIWLIIPAILWQMFLYTGLFITAHDAMHGVVFPQNPKINHFIGSLSVLIYGLFSYKKLLKNHWVHHRHPADELDPDFHDGKNKNPFSWYFHFFNEYWSWKQIIGLMVVFNLAKYLLHIPEYNMTLFWVIPSILSSVQLFYFGTFLPHREPEGGYINPHRAQTISLPVFWSFITCYHFGYHQEHHEYPQVPWWQLPSVHKMRSHPS